MSIALTNWIAALAAAGAFLTAPSSAALSPTRADQPTRAACAEDENRDKTGTSRFAESTLKPQAPFFSTNSEWETYKAEGMGFEPTTPFGAPDFESGRWPIRLPSEVAETTA
jgi:hypothetical protein